VTVKLIKGSSLNDGSSVMFIIYILICLFAYLKTGITLKHVSPNK